MRNNVKQYPQNNIISSFTITTLIFALFCIHNVQTIQFLLDGEKCLSEELAHDALVIGNYKAEFPLGVRVVNPTATTIWSNSYSSAGSFAFTTDSIGLYTVCFIPDARAPQQQMISLDLKFGIDTEDYDAMVLRDKLSPIHVELKKTFDSLTFVNRHMSYMKHRESAMRDTNESTNSRVMWLSFLSLTVLVTLGLGQIFYLKYYFKSKKLI